MLALASGATTSIEKAKLQDYINDTTEYYLVLEERPRDASAEAIAVKEYSSHLECLIFLKSMQTGFSLAMMTRQNAIGS